jgi:hypothetical protein
VKLRLRIRVLVSMSDRASTSTSARPVCPSACAVTAGPRPSDIRLGRRLARSSPLRNDSLALWEGTAASLPRLGERVGLLRRWRNTRAVARLIDHVAHQVRSYPDDECTRMAWRDAVRERVLRVGRHHLGWSATYGDTLAGDAFYVTAESFAREARRFAPALALEDLGQALRNVWVGNTLQLLVGLPVRLTPGLFAYSMLYPTTDNVLDDPRRSDAAKAIFNARLAARLGGDASPAQDAAEEKPWALVAILEREYPRETCPEVWAALRSIHEAQVASLRQQRGPGVSDDELLGLTVAKGGASLLADLHLITPGPDAATRAFVFRYGVFLQMLDDLQDVGPDLAAGHDTPFTRAARRGPLDTLAARLALFIDVVLDSYAGNAAHPCDDVLELIRQNCRALLVGVMAREPGRFSRPFRRHVASQWPVGLLGMRRLIRHGHHRFAATRADLQRARGLDSPLGLLLTGSPSS